MNFQEGEKWFIGAGVLPITPDHQRVLIGREPVIKDWVASGHWADFGGGTEPGDEDLAHTAAREAYEESMGFLGTIDEIRQRIATSTIDVSDVVAEGHPNLYYRTYLVIYEYQPEGPTLFERFFQYLKPCMQPPKYPPRENPLRFIPSCPPGWTEKTAIRWVTKTELKRLRKKRSALKEITW